MNIKISVVVPVYNVEKYLTTCIESIINQTIPFYEIILIDDGSKDKSGELCELLKEKHKQIKVIHQQNSGLSVSRNTGIDNASGDYILFVDSDDTIEKDTCENFSKAIQNRTPDLIVGNITSFWSNKTNPKWHSLLNDEKILSGCDYLLNEYKNKTMYSESVQCLYLRQFLIEKNIRFYPKLLHEDELFIIIAFTKAKSVLPTKIMFYNHLIRENSISTHKNKTPNAISIIKICNILEEYIKNNIPNELQQKIMEHCVDLYYKVYVDAKLNKSKIKIDDCFLKKYGTSKKNKLRYLLYKFNKKFFVFIEKTRRKII